MTAHRSESSGAESTVLHDSREEGVTIEGLDGATPLGFLAALGVLRIVSELNAGSEDGGPAISWRQVDAWRPVLHGVASFDDIVDKIWQDVGVWEGQPVLNFHYVKLEKQGPKRFGGLRAPIAVLRAWLLARRGEDDENSLAYSASLMCETANEPLAEPATRELLTEHGISTDPATPLDRMTLPTFFDFTSRNAQFLDQLRKIRGNLDRTGIASGLETGHPDPAAPRSMDWDPMADTPGAIYTGYIRGFRPVAEWLAFRGLVHFPVTGKGETLRTTACSGRRKAGTFVWPLWDRPAGPGAVKSLVAYPGLETLGATARQALGIVSIFRAGLVKQADRRGGMFAPAEPIPPPPSTTKPTRSR